MILHVHNESHCHCALHENSKQQHFSKERVRSFSLSRERSFCANLLRMVARDYDAVLGHLPNRIAAGDEHDRIVICCSRRIRCRGPHAAPALFVRRLSDLRAAFKHVRVIIGWRGYWLRGTRRWWRPSWRSTGEALRSSRSIISNRICARVRALLRQLALRRNHSPSEFSALSETRATHEQCYCSGGRFAERRCSVRRFRMQQERAKHREESRHLFRCSDSTRASSSARASSSRCVCASCSAPPSASACATQGGASLRCDSGVSLLSASLPFSPSPGKIRRRASTPRLPLGLPLVAAGKPDCALKRKERPGRCAPCSGESSSSLDEEKARVRIIERILDAARAACAGDPSSTTLFTATSSRRRAVCMRTPGPWVRRRKYNEEMLINF